MGETASMLAQYASENRRLRDQLIAATTHVKQLTELHRIAVDGWHESHKIADVQSETIRLLRDRLAQLDPAVSHAMFLLSEQEGRGHESLCCQS